MITLVIISYPFSVFIAMFFPSVIMSCFYTYTGCLQYVLLKRELKMFLTSLIFVITVLHCTVLHVLYTLKTGMALKQTWTYLTDSFTLILHDMAWMLLCSFVPNLRPSLLPFHLAEETASTQTGTTCYSAERRECVRNTCEGGTSAGAEERRRRGGRENCRAWSD